MELRTEVLATGGTTAGIVVPDDVVAALGGGRRPKVVVSVNGFTYRTSVAPVDGRFLVPLSAERRAAAGVAAGDAVDVTLELDTAPREVTVPDDLAAALDAQPGSRARFDALSFSNQQRHVLAVEGAKAPETRARRVEKVVAALSEQPGA
ncbi:YdeI/OmpD-associated family protein [Cellulomonas sp. 179-A 4D5 NHS]|uniref:YdeI/OmpD-associated family protein n=1 Tax=Cellulomonas sp. 179-A 4D5 NHS TaxID=3142378 RepID=UPI0039A0CE79